MSSSSLRPFHVLAKPTGPICNLDCTYCFYLEKEKLYPPAEHAAWRMPDEVLETFIRDTIRAQPTPEVHFAWQGGEPTLLGVGFFRRAVELQRKYAEGRAVHNAFQTNGVLLDDEWGEFLAVHQFLVGLSIDGPEKFHDRYRVDKGGQPTFRRVMQGLAALQRHGVEFNTLTCVQRHNSRYPLEIYSFLKQIGSRFLQFIPIVERQATGTFGAGAPLAPVHAEAASVTSWSVEPLQYGIFLSTIFDEWVRRDVGRTYVQIFDVALQSWLGIPPDLCVFRETCGDALALEHNGDLYSCDHFVYPDHRLGNIQERSLLELAGSEQQRAFGNAKRDTLPRYCRECEVRFACNGECPKHRFLRTPEGEPGLNYLCAGYKHFFRHIDPCMRFMAAEWRAGRPPANVMDWLRYRDRLAAQPATAGRNDPCPCGSGKKFKRCCGMRS